MDYSRQLATAKRVALEAGSMLVQQKRHEVESAADAYNGVRDAIDVSGDDYVRTTLGKSFPDYGLLSEENPSRKINEFTWVIDPRDGTNNAMRGSPYYSVSIGLQRNGRGVVGVVYAPELNRLYYAQKGAGAFVKHGGRARRLQISEAQRSYSRRMFTPSFCCVADLEDQEKWFQVIESMKKSSLFQTMRRRMVESTALELCGIAEGWYDAHFNNYPMPWDWAASDVILREAGGSVAHLDAGIHGVLVAHNSAFGYALVDIVKEVFKK